MVSYQQTQNQCLWLSAKVGQQVGVGGVSQNSKSRKAGSRRRRELVLRCDGRAGTVRSSANKRSQLLECVQNRGVPAACESDSIYQPKKSGRVYGPDLALGSKSQQYERESEILALTHNPSPGDIEAGGFP